MKVLIADKLSKVGINWLEEQDDDVVREARDLLESGQPGLAALEILELLDEPVEQLAEEGRQNEFYAWLRMIS